MFDALVDAAQFDSSDWLSQALYWGKHNPEALNFVAQLGGGALQSLGEYVTTNDLLAKKIAAQRGLQEQDLRLAIELETWKRQHVQNGDFWSAKIPFKPSPKAQGALRRPDGKAVFAKADQPAPSAAPAPAPEPSSTQGPTPTPAPAPMPSPSASPALKAAEPADNFNEAFKFYADKQVARGAA